MALLMAGVSKAFPSPFAPKSVTGNSTEPCPVFWPSRVSGKLISGLPTNPALATFRNLRRAFKSEIIDGDSTGSLPSQEGTNNNGARRGKHVGETKTLVLPEWHRSRRES